MDFAFKLYGHTYAVHVTVALVSVATLNLALPAPLVIFNLSVRDVDWNIKCGTLSDSHRFSKETRGHWVTAVLIMGVLAALHTWHLKNRHPIGVYMKHFTPQLTLFCQISALSTVLYSNVKTFCVSQKEWVLWNQRPHLKVWPQYFRVYFWFCMF